MSDEKVKQFRRSSVSWRSRASKHVKVLDEVGKYYFGFLSEYPQFKPIGISLNTFYFVLAGDEIRKDSPASFEIWIRSPQLFQLPIFVHSSRPEITLIHDPNHAEALTEIAFARYEQNQSTHH